VWVRTTGLRGARSDPDFINKIGHVVEEADETVYWLDLIKAAGVCTDSHLAPLLRESAELSAIFNQSQITAKKNAGRFKKARPPGTSQ
jgi:four helix bundle protein